MLTFADVDSLLDHLEQVARDTRRAAVTDLLLLADGDDGDEDDLADRLDADRERHEAELQQWRVKAQHQLAALPLAFPLTVDWTTRQPQEQGSGWQRIGRLS